MAMEQIPSTPESDRRQGRLELVERRTELPLMLRAGSAGP